MKERRAGCLLRCLGCFGVFVATVALFFAIVSHEGRWIAPRTSFADIELLHAASGGSFHMTVYKNPVGDMVWGYNAAFSLRLDDGTETSWWTNSTEAPGDFDTRLDGLVADLPPEERARRRKEFIAGLESTRGDAVTGSAADLSFQIAAQAVRRGQLERFPRSR
ncbi:MAG: hypothetical protein AAGB93_25260 [Planctomycetota bacterium]